MHKALMPVLTAIFCHAALATAPAPEEVRFASLDGTELKAWVFQPAATEAPHGTVVALHGCGGLYATSGARQGLLNARHQAMADRLVEAGYTVVFPDSLTPRGVREICTQKINQRAITQRERRRDVLATLNWVQAQPWGRGGKVALLGWSNGGSALLAATDGNNPEVKAQTARFATAIAFYPGCNASLKSGYVPNTSLTLLVGEKDDWTPAAPCVALGQSVGARVTVFPDSYHDFDNPAGRLRVRADVPNGVHPGQGVHVGPNPEARDRANALVLERLKDALH